MEKADSLFWPYTSNGDYTSKSGYQFLKKEASTEYSVFNPQPEIELWRGIWSLNVPNMVKILFWRACWESLPSKQNLMQRTIIDCSTCDQCKHEAETALHALWACKELDVVWGDANLWGFRRSTSFLSFKELLSWIIKNHQQPELFAVNGWSIWNQQNQVRMHQPSYSPLLLATSMRDRLVEFISVQLAHSVPLPWVQVQW